MSALDRESPFATGEWEWESSPPAGPVYGAPVTEAWFDESLLSDDEAWAAAERERELEGPGAAGLSPGWAAGPVGEWEAPLAAGGFPAAEALVTSGGSLPPDVVAALRRQAWSAAVALAVRAGRRDENQLTDMVFHARHPERAGGRILPHESGLAREWRDIRDRLVRPALSAPAAPPPVPAAAPAGARSTTWLRRAWAGHACEKSVRMVQATVLGHRTPVNPLTVDAWAALDRALTATGYQARSVWNFVCRPITGGKELSLHAYGIATDIDPTWHPYRVTPDRRPVRFSGRSTQQERAQDVVEGRADTAFTPQQVAAVEGIRTVDGLQALAWGGRWAGVKDAMHFQVNVSPAELGRGLAR